MTEQPVETMSEERWLGNADPTVRPIDPDEIRVRNAKRVAPAPLTAPSYLCPTPVVAMSRPYKVAQANILLRKSITAAAKLQQARKASEQAEEAMKAALAAEHLAEIDATNAEQALLAFTREAADQ